MIDQSNLVFSSKIQVMSSEKYYLKWNTFQTNVSKSFNELRTDKDFFDVTLIGDDESKLSAHRIVLSSCSSFFKSILRITSNSNPVIYLSGVNSQNLGFMLDYMYQGEVQIFQEQLDDFLSVAQKLKIDGLIGLISNKKSEEQLHPQKIEEEFDYETPPNLPMNPNSKKSIVRKERSKDEVKLSNTENTQMQIINFDGQLSVTDIDINELEKRIENLIDEEDGIMKCRVCGRTSNASTKVNMRQNLKKHVEIHINGLSVDCHLCNKTFRSRESLRIHKHKRHS